MAIRKLNAILFLFSYFCLSSQFVSTVSYEKINCQFREDLCGWQSNYSDSDSNQLSWSIGIGRVANVSRLKFIKPLELTNGVLYSDFTMIKSTGNLKKYTMELLSEFVEPTESESCLTIDYFVKTIGINNKYQIDLIDFNGNRLPLWTHSNNDPVMTNWTQKQISVLNPIDGPYRISMIASASDPSTYIAIRQVNYSAKQCHFKQNTETRTTSDCPTYKCLDPSGGTICVRPDQLCNFRSDCKDESDEQNCGNTNFDDWLTRGWNVKELRYGMKVILPAKKGPDNLPHFDGNHSSSGGYLAFLNGDSKNHSITLASPRINAQTPSSCKFQLDYFSGSKDVNIRLKILHNSSMVEYFLNDSSSGWKHQTVEIGEKNESFKIEILVDSKKSLNGWETFALDNLYFVDCKRSNQSRSTIHFKRLSLMEEPSMECTEKESNTTERPSTTEGSRTEKESSTTERPRTTEGVKTTEGPSTKKESNTTKRPRTTEGVKTSKRLSTKKTKSTTTSQPKHLNSKLPNKSRKLVGILLVPAFMIVGLIGVGLFLKYRQYQRNVQNSQNSIWVNGVLSDI